MTVPFPKVFHRRTAFPFIFIGRERSRLQVVCVPTSSTGTSCGGARHSTRTRRTVPAPASRPGCAVSSSPLSVRPGRGVPSPPPPSPCPPTLPQGRRLQHPRLPRAPVTPATCPALRRARACCCQRGRSRWVRRRRRPSPRPCATAWPIRLRRRRAWHPRLLFGAVACARTRVTRSSHGRRGPPPPPIPMVGAAWHGMAPCGTGAAAVDAWSAMAGCATRGHRGSSGQAAVGGGCRRAASGGGRSCA